MQESSVALTNDQVAFSNVFVDHTATQPWKPAKIAELIKETLQSPVPAGLDILLQIGTRRMKQNHRVEPQNITLADGRVSFHLRQCGFSK
jgi:hypothetical protein